jgi:hypothetical protein
LAAVKQNGYAIHHIENPSEDVQLEAVREDGHSIMYIKNPSDYVKSESSMQNKKKNCNFM